MWTLKHSVTALLLMPSLAHDASVNDLQWPLSQSFPPAVYEAFAKFPSASKFVLSSNLNPFYLHGDFNGDGRLDTAVLIKEKASQKIGVAIIHGGSGVSSLWGQVIRSVTAVMISVGWTRGTFMERAKFTEELTDQKHPLSKETRSISKKLKRPALWFTGKAKDMRGISREIDPLGFAANHTASDRSLRATAERPVRCP
jgi:hypothetical protein